MGKSKNIMVKVNLWVGSIGLVLSSINYLAGDLGEREYLDKGYITKTREARETKDLGLTGICLSSIPFSVGLYYSKKNKIKDFFDSI